MSAVDKVKPRSIKWYGWKPDLPDHRDLKFTRPANTLLPVHTVSLFDKFNIPPIYDQGQLGSCTANALAGLVEFYLMNKSQADNPSAALYMPSRLFIYYYERVIEGSINSDSGAQLRDGIKVLAAKGVADENKWPYDISTFTDHPSKDAVKEAHKFLAVAYSRIDNTNKGLLVAALDEGHPIAFGFTVYESFESQTVAVTGDVPMPGPNESILGGHATVIVGYNADTDKFLVRNSWGKDWGINGYFHMPAAYLTNEDLADDFWIISSMQTP
jgi:C1A family cysteine protease